MVAQGVVDLPMVSGERPPGAAGCPPYVGPPGDRSRRGLRHPHPAGVWVVSPQGAELRIREEGGIPYARTVARLAGASPRHQAFQSASVAVTDSFVDAHGSIVRVCSRLLT